MSIVKSGTVNLLINKSRGLRHALCHFLALTPRSIFQQ